MTIFFGKTSTKQKRPKTAGGSKVTNVAPVQQNINAAAPAGLPPRPPTGIPQQTAPSRPYRTQQLSHGAEHSQPVPHFRKDWSTSHPHLPSQSSLKPGGQSQAAKWSSSADLPAGLTPKTQTVSNGDGYGQYTARDQGTALCDIISSKFDRVISLIDEERFSGDERELVVFQQPPLELRGGGGPATRTVARGADQAISTAITSTNYFEKANLYANSKLPRHLPPLRLYIETFPILCIAAEYSQRVYAKPSGKERATHVNANWRNGTKAMVIKSVPKDNMNIIIFAIRGSQTFMDWAVNVNAAPTAPDGFLDDPGNLCHSGFLHVARKMVKPVAARLRTLLEEDPARASCSLLITGHSAGGAVASLLYSHMLARTLESELTILAGCFKRVHCITFGAPPTSLLPLQNPSDPRLRKCLFLSFVNEGDPVPRADKAYVRSLLALYSTPSPTQPSCTSVPAVPKPSKLPLSSPFKRPKPTRAQTAPAAPLKVWPVPPCTLSNAGRLVLLRSVWAGHDEKVAACVVSDQQLRGVVFGDPVKHMMKLYASRIDAIATNAVLAKDTG